jgi:hypothetical protein
MSSNRTKVVGNQVVTTAEVRTQRFDISVGTGVTVCAAPALLRGANIYTGTNAYEVSIKNGAAGTAEDAIPASTPAGSWIPYGDAYYPNGIYLTYDASVTGNVAIKYIPLG